MTGTTGGSAVVVPVVGLRLVVVEPPGLLEPAVLAEPPVFTAPVVPVLGSLLAAVEAPASTESLVPPLPVAEVVEAAGDVGGWEFCGSVTPGVVVPAVEGGVGAASSWAGRSVPQLGSNKTITMASAVRRVFGNPRMAGSPPN